jgi:hypothetical protein
MVVILGVWYVAMGGTALGSMSTIATSYDRDVIVCAVEGSRGQ